MTTEISVMYGSEKVNPIIQYWKCLFFININVFRYLRLKIVLAIPASN